MYISISRTTFDNFKNILKFDKYFQYTKMTLISLSSIKCLNIKLKQTSASDM